MPAALKEAIHAGLQLRKVAPAEPKPGRLLPVSGPFVPNPADLLKLKASLRKTGAGTEEPAAAPAAEPAADAAATVATEPIAVDVPAAEALTAGQEAPDAAEQEFGQAAADIAVPADLEIPAAEQPAAQADEELAPAPTEEVEVPGAEAEEAVVPEASALKKRKSVRFNPTVEAQDRTPLGTPEGAAADATITIRLRRGDIEQVQRSRRAEACWCLVCCYCCLVQAVTHPVSPSCSAGYQRG